MNKHLVYIPHISKRITKRDIRKHFTKYGKILSLEYTTKPKKTNSRFILLSCSSEQMKNSIVHKKFSIKSKFFRVYPFLEGKQLNNYKQEISNCRIYFKKLPLDFTVEILLNTFEKYGKILKGYCTLGNKKYKYGYIHFENSKSIQNIPTKGISLNGELIHWNIKKDFDECNQLINSHINQKLSQQTNDNLLPFYPKNLLNQHPLENNKNSIEEPQIPSYIKISFESLYQEELQKPTFQTINNVLLQDSSDQRIILKELKTNNISKADNIKYIDEIQNSNKTVENKLNCKILKNGGNFDSNYHNCNQIQHKDSCKYRHRMNEMHSIPQLMNFKPTQSKQYFRLSFKRVYQHDGSNLRFNKMDKNIHSKEMLV